MNQTEIISKIKEKEKEAHQIIEKAKAQAEQIVQKAKTVLKKEIIANSINQAQSEAASITEANKEKTAQALKTIEAEHNKNKETIEKTASKNNQKAVDYILEEILKLWELQN